MYSFLRSSSAKLAILIFLATFGLYASTASEFQGYEVSTAAVTDSLVRHGSLKISQDNPFDAAYARKDNKLFRPSSTFPPTEPFQTLYSSTGIVQPLLQVPFYSAGWAIDGLTGSGSTYRTFLIRLFNPAVTGLASVGIFFLVLWTRRSTRWAVATSLMFGLATLAWPYSKIGMEPILMLMIIGAFLAAWKAQESKGCLWWVLTGLIIGLAAGTKPYGLIAALGVFPLLIPAFKRVPWSKRRLLLISLVLPIIILVCTYLWYNGYRTGSILSTGYPSPPYSWAAPISFFGSLFSPGKGLIWYSPLVVLGALGFSRLWRSNRPLGAALIATFLLGAFPAFSGWWGDEAWGPRYLVPVAWILLVPIAWWGRTVRKQQIIIGVTAFAVFVQLLGVSFRYDQYANAVASGDLTGAKVYANRTGFSQNLIPYGDDPTRWIPEISPLLFNAEALYSKIHRLAGRGDRTIYYAPYEGHVGKFNFSRVAFPDLWWISPTHRMTSDQPTYTTYKEPPGVLVIFFFALFATSLYGIRRLLSKPVRARKRG